MKYVNYAVETKVNKRNTLAALMILLAVIGFAVTLIVVRPHVVDTKVVYDKQVSMEKQIKSLTDSANAKKNQLGSEKKKTSSDLVKSQLVAEVGAMAEKHTLSVDKLTSENPENITESDLSAMTFNIELKGQLADIQGFIADLDARDNVSHVTKLSYRLADQEFVWMERAIDQDQAVSWMGTRSEKDEEKAAAEEEETLPSITVSDLLQRGVATCYMQVQFIGRA